MGFCLSELDSSVKSPEGGSEEVTNPAGMRFAITTV
jgi:hypothetical protein